MPASEEVVVVEATGGRGGGRTRAVLRTACGTLYGFVRTVAKTAYGSIRLAEVIAKGPGSPRDLALHGHVAIKVYERSNLLAPRGAGWLENPTGELAALSDLSLDGGHAGIVRLFEVCASPRAVFAVMEYLDGAELFARVSVGGALPPSDARDVIRQLARALDFMHGKGICHRDVSLENAVLVGAAPAPAYHGAAPADTTTTTPPANNLVVKLIDLGLCGRVAGGGFPPRAPCGKRFYMAPEILSSSAHDTKVDMWAIGCGRIFLPPAGARTYVHAHGHSHSRTHARAQVRPVVSPYRESAMGVRGSHV
jgi:serine/threonine protein kinase